MNMQFKKRTNPLQNVEVDKKKYFTILFLGTLLSALIVYLGVSYIFPTAGKEDLLCVFALLVMIITNAAMRISRKK